MTKLIPPSAPRHLWVPEKYRAAPAPRRGSQMAAAPQQLAGGSGSAGSGYYDALKSSLDRTPINARAYSRDWSAVLRTMDRDHLIALARHLYDNNGVVSYAVDTIANYTTPLTPQPSSPNPDWNKAALEYWEGWTKRADFTGRFSFNTLQRMVSKSLDVDGDTGAMLTTENGFAQVQLIESWRIRTPRHALPLGLLVGDGVVFDPKGRVAGYFLDTEAGMIPSDQLRLWYDPDRFMSYRGVTPVRRGSNDVRDMGDIKGFEKLATKIGAALAAVIEQDGPLEEDVWGNNTGEDGDDPGVTAAQFDQKLSIADLLGGDIPTVPLGSKLHQLSNNRPGDKVPEFLQYLAASFVLGLGLPPAFFLDERMSGPNNRAVNGKAQRKFNQRQDEVQGPFLEWSWCYVMADAIDRGKLPSQAGFDRISWMGPPKLTIDEGRDANQRREDQGRSLLTRRDHFGERGQDWIVETDQCFSEDEHIISRAKDLAQRTGVPLTAILARYGFATAAQASPDSESDDEDAANDTEKPKPKP